MKGVGGRMRSTRATFFFRRARRCVLARGLWIGYRCRASPSTDTMPCTGINSLTWKPEGTPEGSVAHGKIEIGSSSRHGDAVSSRHAQAVRRVVEAQARYLRGETVEAGPVDEEDEAADIHA